MGTSVIVPPGTSLPLPQQAAITLLPGSLLPPYLVLKIGTPPAAKHLSMKDLIAVNPLPITLPMFFSPFNFLLEEIYMFADKKLVKIIATV